MNSKPERKCAELELWDRVQEALDARRDPLADPEVLKRMVECPDAAREVLAWASNQGALEGSTGTLDGGRARDRSGFSTRSVAVGADAPVTQSPSTRQQSTDLQSRGPQSRGPRSSGLRSRGQEEAEATCPPRTSSLRWGRRRRTAAAAWVLGIAGAAAGFSTLRSGSSGASNLDSPGGIFGEARLTEAGRGASDPAKVDPTPPLGKPPSLRSPGPATADAHGSTSESSDLSPAPGFLSFRAEVLYPDGRRVEAVGSGGSGGELRRIERAPGSRQDPRGSPILGSSALLVSHSVHLPSRAVTPEVQR